MREDMAKIVVDKGRKKYYNTGKTKHFNSSDKEEGYSSALPSKEGMRAPHVRNYGYPNLLDNLNPLYGWIRKQVGRHWDDVYSELIGGLKNMPDIHRVHIMSHVDHFVNYKMDAHGRWADYEVKNGILVEVKKKKFVKEKKPLTEFVKDGIKYKKENGIWFSLKETKKQETAPIWKDGEIIGFRNYESIKTTKRSLSKKELKNFGVEND